MKNLKLFLIPMLFALGITQSYGQDVQMPFSWVSATGSTSSTVGLFQCGTMNVTLNSGSPHRLIGTTARMPLPGDGTLNFPVTLTFSKPVCNLGLLVNDLDLNMMSGTAYERLEFTTDPLPVGLDPASGGPPFNLAYVGSILTGYPVLATDTKAWVNWEGPLTSITFDYYRLGTSWNFSLDSLRFDCDCSIPKDLNCCEGNGRQMLSWADVPGATGYQIEFGFNDASSGCCDSETGYPSGWLENVSDNVFVVPESFADCFWWRVRTVFDDGSYSDWSEKICDCFEPETASCTEPINLDCEWNTSGQKLLSWDPVVGALGYEVSKTYNDPACCPASIDPISTVVVSTTNTFVYDPDPNACFSWKVRAICSTEPLYSEWSVTKCTSDCEFPMLKSDVPTELGFEDGIEIEISEVEMTLVPNPTKDHVTITVFEFNHETNGKAILSIKDIHGREVRRESIVFNEPQSIDLKDVKAGIYICDVLWGDNLVVTSRLVID